MVKGPFGIIDYDPQRIGKVLSRVTGAFVATEVSNIVQNVVRDAIQSVVGRARIFQRR